MAQTAANPAEAHGLGWTHRRAAAASTAVAVAIGLVVTLMAVSEDASTGAGLNAAVSPPATIALVDDFVTRRYLSSVVPDEDSWKDDAITRRYLPGS